MSQLRTILRDLVDRRLWPLAALLAVGLVAVPMVFLRPSPNAASSAPTAVAATPAATPAVTGATLPAAAAATSSGDPLADPSVGLTSSPFAAAFAGPLDLPPAMQGLLKATKGTDERGTVADAPLRDPFATGASATPAATTSTSTAAPAPSSGGATARSASTSTGANAAPAPATTPPVAGPSTPAAAQSTPSPTPVSTVVGKPAAPPASPSAASRIFKTDVSFGTTATAPLDGDATRLTAYPSSFNPVAVFLGVMRGGWGAVFMLRDDVRPVGAPSCRPRRSICTWVVLHPGESVTLNAKDAATGTVTPYTLKVAAIREDKVSEEAALAAANKANSAGRCLLGPLAAYHYDSKTGTLTLNPEMKACRYAGDPSTSVGTTGSGTTTTTPTDTTTTPADTSTTAGTDPAASPLG